MGELKPQGMIVADRAGELSLTGVGELLMLATGPIKSSDGERALAVLRTDPRALEGALEAVYNMPELIKVRREQAPTLGEIRRDFPTITGEVDNGSIGELLTSFDESHRAYPSLVARVGNTRSLIRAAGFDPSEIKTVELVLRFLIEDGNVGSTNQEDFRNTITSHEVFAEFCDLVERKKIQPGVDEQEAFTKIGQNLLIKRRAYTSPKGAPKEEMREFTYGRRAAQVTLFLRIVNLSKISGDREATRRAFSDLNSALEGLFAEYPEQTQQIKSNFGNVLLTTVFERWIDQPGAPSYEEAQIIMGHD